jgi:hypothetical protein
MHVDDWLASVRTVTSDIAACWESIKLELTMRGGGVPTDLKGIGPDEYINGTFIFSRVQKLVEDS